MLALRVLPKLFSLFVAGVNFIAAYSSFSRLYDSWYSAGGGSRVEYYVILIAIQIVLILPLLFIWFSDYLASLEFGDQRWRIPHWCRQASLFPCSPSLIKFVGWFFLLLPTVIFTWSKIM